MFENLPVLSLLIWAPVIGGLFVLYAGDRQGQTVKSLSLAISLLVFFLSVLLYFRFDTTTHLMQFVEYRPWIETFSIHYHLGVDGIAVPLILLTTFTTVIVIIAGWEVIEKRLSQYMASFLILEGLMNGVFASLDAILFYFFWEAMLIPMFLIIGVWGGPNRVYATVKFFLYTFLGSVFMLVALLYLYSRMGSFYILDLHKLPLPLVKIPMWPVHTWLPDAHVEAPTGGSVILAAIMLKMGGYGFIRFSLPVVPDASAAFGNFMIILSLIAIAYIGFVALVQTDMKKLIAYSSISHMGFVTLGFFVIFSIFTATQMRDGVAMALEGGMMQMISHGFISGALFLCVGVMYERVHSRDISFLVILSSFQAAPWIAVVAATTLILGAAYTLWMYKRVIFGEVANENVAGLKEISMREGAFLTLLAVVVLLLGVWPDPLFEIMHASIEHLVGHVLQSKIG